VTTGSFRLDVGRPDHLGPLFRLIGESLPNSAGVIGIGMKPRSASRPSILGSASTALISLNGARVATAALAHAAMLRQSEIRLRTRGLSPT
jgi:hypothetical protein